MWKTEAHKCPTQIVLRHHILYIYLRFMPHFCALMTILALLSLGRLSLEIWRANLQEVQQLTTSTSDNSHLHSSLLKVAKQTVFWPHCLTHILAYRPHRTPIIDYSLPPILQIAEFLLPITLLIYFVHFTIYSHMDLSFLGPTKCIRPEIQPEKRAFTS